MKRRLPRQPQPITVALAGNGLLFLALACSSSSSGGEASSPLPSGTAGETESNDSEATGDDPTNGDATGNDPTGDDPTSGDATGNDATGNDPTGSDPTGSDPTSSDPTGSDPTSNAGGEESTGPATEGPETTETPQNGDVASAGSTGAGGAASEPAPSEPAPSEAGSANASGGGSFGGAAAGGTASEPSNPPEAPRLERILAFSRTEGFRHDSIGAGLEMLRTLGEGNDFVVDASEDAGTFNDDDLAEYDVVVFLSTTGDVLNADQQQAFERYVQAGGGWVGVHSASDTEYDWAWYGQLVGAYFRAHPSIQAAQLDVEIAAHPSTEHLPARFELTDEWYNFRENPRSSVNVLMTLDESSYSPGNGAMGDHPIAWFHDFDGGRAWYTALGHRTELYTDSVFTQHVWGGIRWAAGVSD